jgi:hypothetical protein
MFTFGVGLVCLLIGASFGVVIGGSAAAAKRADLELEIDALKMLSRPMMFAVDHGAGWYTVTPTLKEAQDAEYSERRGKPDPIVRIRLDIIGAA